MFGMPYAHLDVLFYALCILFMEHFPYNNVTKCFTKKGVKPEKADKKEVKTIKCYESFCVLSTLSQKVNKVKS